jgi:acetyl-CoA acetyltransferase
MQAITSAVNDAGLTLQDVDGLATFSIGDSVGPALVSQALGLKDIRYYVHQAGGGAVSHSVIGQAAMAVASGVADTVVCYRALNSRSEFRMGGSGFGAVFRTQETQYKEPYGYFSAPHEFAMFARTHMNKYGTTHEQFGTVAITERENAILNDRATMRKPLSMDDYLASRWVAEPFRLLDCCLESDGACAFVLTRSEVARNLASYPVLISGVVWGPGHTLQSNGWYDLTESGAMYSSPRLYSAAGIGPTEIDVAELYDCFTYSVLVQLEDYGFCPKGEAGPFVESGAIRIGGSIPVNTHGGFLSEAYIHGFNTLYEAVQQLRHVCGARQVADAEVALSTGQGGFQAGETSAVLLRRG